MGKFNSAKQFIGQIFGSKVSPTIKSVKPTFPKTKMTQALRDVKMTALKTKGSIKKGSQDMDRDIQKVKSKLGQTMQKLKGEPVTKSGVSKGKDLREKKMGGGMMGRRFGMKMGTPKPKTNVQKIKEAFSTKGKKLKPVDPKKQKGLSKLPREVRNKMGYMKSGGRA